MRIALLAATAATSLFATAASAQTVLNTSLQNQGGTVGTPGLLGVTTPSTRTTTTDASGTRTTVSANPGAANDDANRGHSLGIPGTWYQDNVGMGSTVGITTDYARSGNGSAYFNQTQAQNGKADLQYLFGSFTPLTSLTSFSYDYLRAGSSTNDPNQAPVLRLNIFKGATFAGSLVYEPYYTTNGAAAVGTWTTMSGDLTNGIWWSTNALLGYPPQEKFQTLQAWIDGNPGLSVYGLQVGFGSGWTGVFTGAVDNVKVNFAGGPSTNFNFEVAAAAPVPEPATWGMMILGLGAAGYAMRRRRVATLRTA